MIFDLFICHSLLKRTYLKDTSIFRVILISLISKNIETASLVLRLLILDDISYGSLKAEAFKYFRDVFISSNLSPKPEENLSQMLKALGYAIREIIHIEKEKFTPFLGKFLLELTVKLLRSLDWSKIDFTHLGQGICIDYEELVRF